MGLIKAAIIGGAAYFAVKSINGEKREGCCARRKRVDTEMVVQKREQDGTRTLPYTDEKKPGIANEPYQPALNPPSYPHDQYPFQYGSANQYYNNEKQEPTYHDLDRENVTPASPKHQQMTFIEPKQRWRLSDVVAYNKGHNKHETGVVSSAPASNVSKADMVVDQAIFHLQAGREDKARELLGRAVQS